MLLFKEPDPTIFDPTQSDPGLADTVRTLGAADIFACTQCGKCAAACPLVLTGFPFFNKRLIQTILMGFKELLLNDASIWACQSCNRCTEVCPQGIDSFGIILAARRFAVSEYALPAMAVEGLRSLYETGHAVHLAEAGPPRKKIGLPEKPPTTLTFSKALGEVQAIMRRTALAKLGIIPMGPTGESLYGITDKKLW